MQKLWELEVRCWFNLSFQPTYPTSDFRNSYWIYYYLDLGFSNNIRKLLTRSNSHKYDMSKSSQDESSRLPVMRQSTKKSETPYPVFRTFYLLHFSFRSNIQNEIRKNTKNTYLKKKIVISKLSQNQPCRLLVMQQPTRKS